MFWVLLTTLLSLTTALQWTDSLTNNSVMTVCSASDIHLPWNFTLSPDERIEDIKWIYRAEDGSEGLIAIFAANYFNPMPAFHGRVLWTGQGGIVISQAAVAESGSYTVVVSTADVAHPLVTYSKTVNVQVADPPAAESGELHVLQEQEAVYVNTTGQWRVGLTCGVLTSPGHPAVHVVWTTPDGHTVESSSGYNGTFHLLLPNPPSGGNYTCTLPPLSPATRCLPPLPPLLEGATVTVDQVKASFTLLEARLRESEAKQRETEARFEAKQQNMLMVMSAENARLQAELDTVKDENDQHKYYINVLQNTTDTLKARLATATLRVSFHAMLTSTFTGYGILSPFTVITSEGDAFNGTSGIFTAPRNGTYYFAASAGAGAAEKWVVLHLQKEGTTMTRAWTKRNSGYEQMGSVQATLYLRVGERVWVYSGRSDASHYSDTTSFTGFLVGADDY